MEDNKKYPRTFHVPTSPGKCSDDKVASMDIVEKVLSEEIVITEKLDGENTTLTFGGVYARSHATYTTSSWSTEVRTLQRLIKQDIEEDISLFGENMEGIHSIEYEKLDSYFYLFGLRKNSTISNWKEVEEIAFLLDLKLVPVLFKGKLKDYKELETLIQQFTKEGSKLGGTMEGIILRPTREFEENEFTNNVFKWVRKNHVNTSTHWTKTWKKAKLWRA